LNSKLATYFLLLISNSWGIERERIKPNEIYKFPVVVNESILKELLLLHKEIESKIKTSVLKIDYGEIENKINDLIFTLYGLSSIDMQSIDDFIIYSVDLFHKQEKSKALYPVLKSQMTEYGTIIKP